MQAPLTENWLVPVDARLERERDLAFEAVKLDFVLQQMEIDRQGKTSIVLLDACRDNPLSKNLARSMGTRSAAIGKGLAAVLAELELRLFGHPARQRLSESEAPSINERVGMVIGGHWETRQTPTATMRRDIEIATAAFETLSRELSALMAGGLARLEADLQAAGAPWTPGRRPL